ncbi:spore germination protein [Paenibacillus pabuli]|uniref:spore germination protein n=1 Tax=Paenibacillus pabuli TaxID=1472 RepID=UPI0009EA4686|nr:spore germination protein [Paenibacillus pabuli]MEC0128233.1 spore germination protein [Paenibacillus pabuli]
MNVYDIDVSLVNTVEWIRSELGESPDVVIRSFTPMVDKTVAVVTIFYIDGLIDQQLLTKMLDSMGNTSDACDLKDWIKGCLPIGNLKTVNINNQLLMSILEGQVVIIVEGLNEAFTVSMAGGVRRSVEEPTSQTVIRGPKEAFTEDFSTNMALLRRKIRTPELRFESMTIGEYTQTKVCVAFIKGIADPEVVSEVTRRLKSIQTDSILESGYIEEFIQDGVYTPFPTIMNTERPDAVAGGLLEGLVAIIVDGTPFVLLAPVTFFRFFISSEDYYQRYDISSFLRVIRFSSFVIALLLPSIFIAITTYHQEMLPTTLLISLAAQRENTPLPALLEAFVMELTFEVIREAGVRMPRAIGPAISIVGALVLGQAAVQAGLVSAAMVIVVSFTAISNFVLPAINMAAAVRLLRFALMLLAGSLGLYGILAGLVPILVHLVSLQTFGIPYLLPVSPLEGANMKDLIFRFPWWSMRKRPEMISDRNRVRQAPNQKPNSKLTSDEQDNDSTI